MEHAAVGGNLVKTGYMQHTAYIEQPHCEQQWPSYATLVLSLPPSGATILAVFSECIE